MAVVDSIGATNEADAHVASCLETLANDDCWVWRNPGNGLDRPRFTIVGRDVGVLGVDVVSLTPAEVERVSSTGITVAGREIDPVSDTGRRLESLRRQLPPGTPLRGLIALPELKQADFERAGLDAYIPIDVAICADTLETGEWAAMLGGLRLPLDQDTLASIRTSLFPETQFVAIQRVTDGNRLVRTEMRLFLDSQQESVARSMGDGITLLNGVAGSGKTLVLCARARILRSEHAEWDVQILCYNRSLIPYLRRLVGDDSVHIDTFHSWAFQNGITIPFANDEEGELRVRKAVATAIKNGSVTERHDAVLIDEGQDFSPHWLRLAWSAVVPYHGGLLVATDPAQSLYGEGYLGETFPGDQVTSRELRRNYRNTKQIAEFALASVYGLDAAVTESKAVTARHPQMPEFVLSGERVQVIWAPRWDSQAEFIAKEIDRLVSNGIASHADIAVLYTQRAGAVNRLLGALESQAIPSLWVNRDKETKRSVNLLTDEVKLLTVHSSKGLQFPVVFLFGVEALRIPEFISAATEEEANLMRVAYVGMTRAEDLLYLTYTRSCGQAAS